ncbi:MAG: isopentenyl phosphate kinase family protein [Candidatus Heimdallarchaeota archaeon]|nr:isopentenyl phosphate kinase family protein [Candidatus Heimdallarchaeota archaeon]
MTTSDLYIVKLGGSAITDKTKDYTLRPEVLSRVLNEISFSDRKVIIIHGAGSFAHNIAKEYNLANGEDPSISLDLQYKGVAITRRSLLNLHSAVLDATMKANLIPFSFPVSAIFVSSGAKHMHSKYLDGLDEALANGFTPILYGDISFDIETKFRVISGDRIIRVLVNHIKTLKSLDDHSDIGEIKVVFGSNVDGLYDKDPKNEDAKLIEKISNSEISELIKIAGESAGTDVTGGMKGKLIEIKQISDLGSEVQIVNIMEDNRMYEALIKQDGVRTIITPH